MTIGGGAPHETEALSGRTDSYVLSRLTTRLTALFCAARPSRVNTYWHSLAVTDTWETLDLIVFDKIRGRT